MHACSRLSMESLNSEVQHLLQASLAPGSWNVYDNCISKFSQFRFQHDLLESWPVPIQHILLFIAFLSLHGFAPSTISTHISAIAFIHKLNGWSDLNNSFIISKVKEGCRRINNREDSRLPITFSMLTQLIQKLRPLCNSFDFTLFRASFLLAFFCFLRISEYAGRSRYADTSRVLQVDDIRCPDQNCPSLLVRLRVSKTDQRGRSVTLKVAPLSGSSICPVKAMIDYLAIRPGGVGPLFIHYDSSPLTSCQVNRKIRSCIDLMGMRSQFYSSHSFRIGAATSAALSGLSDNTIKTLGRWRSSAFELYIRPHAIFSDTTHFVV